MATKLLLMEQLSDEVASDISASPENWLKFLDTASRVYKYSFPEQLLIYAQRPDATACASMEIWNKKMFRWVKKGSRGIALIDTNGSKNSLRYVFDVADTYKQRDVGKDVNLWVLHEDMQTLVAENLAGDAGTDSDNPDLAEVLYHLARESAGDAAADAFAQIRYSIPDSYLGELDEFNQRKELRDLITYSTWYVLLRRSNIDPMDYLEITDFQIIRDFNTPDVLAGVGSSVNEIAKPILMQIGRSVRNEVSRRREAARERAAKKTGTNVQRTLENQTDMPYNEFNTLIRESKGDENENIDRNDGENRQDKEEFPKDGAALYGGDAEGNGDAIAADDIGKDDTKKEEVNDGKTDIQPERGLYDSESGTGRDEGDYREVRNSEEGISEGAQEGYVRRDDAEEHAGSASDGDRSGSKAKDREADGGTPEIESGSGQNERSDGMDAAYERYPFPGGGNDSDGTYIQLSLFPSVEEQADIIRTAAAGTDRPAAFFVPDAMVEDILRTGSGRKNTLLHICAKLQEDISGEDFVKFLKAEYKEGGKGFTFDDRKISVWYDREGIRINRGESARNTYDRMVGWDEAAQRIREMYSRGEYASNVIMANALNTEREELASRTYYLFRDSAFPVPDEWNMGTYPETVAAIKKSLENENEIYDIYLKIDSLRKKIAQAGGGPWYVVDRIPQTMERLVDLRNAVPYKEQGADIEEPVPSFITQDEIDSVLRRGGITSGGKQRIYDFFRNHNEKKEEAEFLKKEYGIGGQSDAVIGSEDSFENHDAKGIKITKGNLTAPYASVTLKWHSAAERIHQLVEKNDYLTQEELEKYEERLAAQRLADMQEVQEAMGEGREVSEESVLADIEEPVVGSVSSEEKIDTGRNTEFDSADDGIGSVSEDTPEAENTKEDVGPVYEANQSHELPADEERQMPEPASADEVETINTQDLLGRRFEWDGRKYEIESISMFGDVSIRDVTFEGTNGFPIFRNEKLPWVLEVIK